MSGLGVVMKAKLALDTAAAFARHHQGKIGVCCGMVATVTVLTAPLGTVLPFLIIMLGFLAAALCVDDEYDHPSR